jgi:hypothetical protein
MTSASASDGGFDGAPQVAQAAPPAAPPPAAGGGPAHEMHEHAFSPQKACLEHVARRIGMRAYLKARLDLKPAQMAAWNTFEKAADQVSDKAKASCAALPTEMKERPNFADRLTHRETRAKARLDAIEAVKPSLLALYAELTPEQKEILDRPTMSHHRWHGHHGRG